MPETITPDVALARFLDTISSAAEPFRLTAEVRCDLEDRLADDFAREVLGGTWEKSQEKLLRVARYIGVLAAFRAEAADPGARPGDLPATAVLEAAALCQTLICPPVPERLTAAASLPVALGRFCRTARFVDDARLAQLRQAFSGA